MQAIRWAVTAIAISVGFIAGTSTSARTTSGTMVVQARLETSCTLITSPMTFGTVPIISGNVDTTASITLRCTPGVAYNVSLDQGQNYNGQRRMVSDLGTFPFFRYLNYQIYRNAARTQVWGNTLGQVATGIIPSSGSVQLTAYGRVPASIVLPAGYRDTVTVTVDY